MKRVFIGVVAIAAVSLAFSLGRLTMLEKHDPVSIDYEDVKLLNATTTTEQQITQPTLQAKSTPPKTIETSDQEVVASKTGTKYYYSWCGGAKNISDANKISFASSGLARKAGYLPAVNCKGLK